MGCLMIGVAALLAFAVPASIAPASLVGAYVVIALLAAAAAGTAWWTARSESGGSGGGRPRLATSLTRIALAGLLYGVAVTLIHAAA